ncbi:hypothetical protein ACIPY3_12230 [Paenarthrobacter sp. NPDC089714]|uniref:hypothetical protein n=1 Tax=Paenarthrobacter sp. NPDC089714 TaxID=3364377 RepID=UPI0038218FF4
MDDTTKFLLTLAAGALGGAVVAGIFAMINAGIAHKRESEQWRRAQKHEHDIWTREKKYEAYKLFFYEISRILDWTQDVMNTGRTDSLSTREEAEGIWRMSAAVNLHLPEALAPDFALVANYLADLAQWGRNSMNGVHDPDRYHRLHEENKAALDGLTEAMRADLTI